MTGLSTPLDPAVVIPEAHLPARHRVREAVEQALEQTLFGSRWLLAPLYLGLVGGLVAILIKFSQTFWTLWTHLLGDDFNQVELRVLELLDITLLANLVLIVVFAGYETFASKIGVAEESVDRPHWMGHVDYSGLKMKLIGSIVAISVIGLLQDFLNASPKDDYSVIHWHVLIHLTFLLSGLLFAAMDYVAERRLSLRVANEAR